MRLVPGTVTLVWFSVLSEATSLECALERRLTCKQVIVDRVFHKSAIQVSGNTHWGTFGAVYDSSSPRGDCTLPIVHAIFIHVYIYVWFEFPRARRLAQVLAFAHGNEHCKAVCPS